MGHACFMIIRCGFFLKIPELQYPLIPAAAGIAAASLVPALSV